MMGDGQEIIRKRKNTKMKTRKITKTSNKRIKPRGNEQPNYVYELEIIRSKKKKTLRKKKALESVTSLLSYFLTTSRNYMTGFRLG